jgi:hypothetical protein
VRRAADSDNAMERDGRLEHRVYSSSDRRRDSISWSRRQWSGFFTLIQPRCPGGYVLAERFATTPSSPVFAHRVVERVAVILGRHPRLAQASASGDSGHPSGFGIEREANMHGLNERFPESHSNAEPRAGAPRVSSVPPDRAEPGF